MSFDSQIQQWVQLDNQLKKLNDTAKELRDRRNTLAANITGYAEKNNLSNANIRISDGRLKITKTRVAEPLTFKYVERVLGDVIKNETHVNAIMEHLKNKRDIKVMTEIKRFSNN